MILVVLGSMNAVCQSVLPQNIRAANTLDRLLDFDGINNYDVLYGIPLEERRVIGDTYLDSAWQKATILLKDQKLLEGYMMRYDIRSNQLEIKTRLGIKVLPGGLVRSFITLDSVSTAAKYFINAGSFKDSEGGVSDGFFQVLSDGELPLAKKTSLEIKKADYNIQFSIGDKDDQILKKEKYFYLKGNFFYEMPAQKKKLLPVFGKHSGEAGTFMKINKLSLREENHLKALFEHYNKLIKS